MVALKVDKDRRQGLSHTVIDKTSRGERSAFFASSIKRPRNQLQMIQAKINMQKKGPRVVHEIQETQQVLGRWASIEITTGKLEHKV